MKKHIVAITIPKSAMSTGDYVGSLKSELAQAVDALEGFLEKFDAQ